MDCPRRTSPYGTFAWDIEPEHDRYSETDDTCTHCGSLNPDTLMARLEAGTVELGPTDKSYKVYVHNSGGESFKQTYRTDNKPFYHGHGSPDHDWVTREMDQTKFYFQHLSPEQRVRFVELLNEGKVKVGYPGYFYNLPFFCVPVPVGGGTESVN
jgi:hypothetical protein